MDKVIKLNLMVSVTYIPSSYCVAPITEQRICRINITEDY